jgi:hypothetical protein
MIVLEMMRAMRDFWLMLLDDIDWHREGPYLKRYDKLWN